jgi:diguanylate cyclase (GGDEF)-like protein/PAS domain S-box-containing protein
MSDKSKRPKLNKRLAKIKELVKAEDNINSARETSIITFWYALFGFTWILTTDSILDWLVADPILHKNIQLAKGWLYVLLTTIFIYLIVKRRIDLIKNAVEDMVATHKVLNKTEEELYLQKALTDEIIGTAPVMIAIWDSLGNLKSVNPYALEVLGYDSSQMLYQEWMELLFSDANRENLMSVYEVIREQNMLQNHETELITRDGSKVQIMWNSGLLSARTDGTTEYISYGIDVTKRKFAENELKKMAYYDMLTNLPNRFALEEQVVKLLQTSDHPFALLYLDVDNFKYINDSLGHHIGDDLLKYIAECLKKAISLPNYVSRLGGDEFAILVEQYHDQNDIISVVNQVKKAIGKTWYIYNHNFYISLSIGVALAPNDGRDFNTLSKNADIAMYSAKKEGKDRIMFFEQAIEKDNLYHIDMAKRLQKAIEQQEFELFYQPQHRLSTKEITGFEALIRWKDETRGFISPAEFIPFAEETGQIYAIEKWVFKQAIRQMEIWDQTKNNAFSISINLSSKTIMSDINFAEIELILASYQGNHNKLMVEITETAILKDIDMVISRLNRLKELGIKIALDDFGTGYSSLTHIKLLPIDVVKLDRSFVGQIENKGKDEMIVSSVIVLVNKLGYHLVAEGIENKDQYDYLLHSDCEYGQGYYMNRPMSIAHINQMLRNSD